MKRRGKRCWESETGRLTALTTRNNMSNRVINSFLEGLGGLIWKGSVIASGLVAIGLGLLYTKQESLLYFPEVGGMARSNKRNPKGYQSPSEHRIPFEEHMIACNYHHNIGTRNPQAEPTLDTGFVHSWLLLQDTDKSMASKFPTLVFFHGNAGNIGHRIPNAKNYYNHLGVNVLMVEYRGYGDSTNDTDRPTERGIKNDAVAVLHYLRSLPYVDPNKILLFGQSLGGACALYLAHYAESEKIPLAGVIVENTFLSIPKMVDVIMPYLRYLKKFVLKMDWNNEHILTRGIKTPILFLAGDKDELVPHHHMLRLYNLSSTGERGSHLTELYVVKGGRHNDTWMRGGRQYYEKMNSFISSVLIHPVHGLRDLNSREVEDASTVKSSIEVDMGIADSERRSPFHNVNSRSEDRKKVN